MLLRDVAIFWCLSVHALKVAKYMEPIFYPLVAVRLRAENSRIYPEPMTPVLISVGRRNRGALPRLV